MKCFIKVLSQTSSQLQLKLRIKMQFPLQLQYYQCFHMRRQGVGLYSETATVSASTSIQSAFSSLFAQKHSEDKFNTMSFKCRPIRTWKIFFKPSNPRNKLLHPDEQNSPDAPYSDIKALLTLSFSTSIAISLQIAIVLHVLQKHLYAAISIELTHKF